MYVVQPHACFVAMQMKSCSLESDWENSVSEVEPSCLDMLVHLGSTELCASTVQLNYDSTLCIDSVHKLDSHANVHADHPMSYYGANDVGHRCCCDLDIVLNLNSACRSLDSGGFRLCSMFIDTYARMNVCSNDTVGNALMEWYDMISRTFRLCSLFSKGMFLIRIILLIIILILLYGCFSSPSGWIPPRVIASAALQPNLDCSKCPCFADGIPVSEVSSQLFLRALSTFIVQSADVPALKLDSVLRHAKGVAYAPLTLTILIQEFLL